VIGIVQLFTGTPGGAMPAGNAEVYLIQHDALLGTLTAVDTVVTDTNGYYWFDSIAAGDYLIKAALLPVSPDYWNYVPTYLGDVLFWSSATTVNIPLNAILTPNPINLQPGVNPGGPGFVGGLISTGANKTAGPGDPEVHVQVMLLNMNDTPVQYTYTDMTGQFSLTNIAYGTYKVWAEVPGKTTVPVIVEINAQNPTVSNLQIEVNTTGIILQAEGPAPVSFQWSAYPNPAHQQLTLSLEMAAASPITVQVLDLSGRILETQQRTLPQGTTHWTLPLNQPAGMYLLRLQTPQQSQTIKLMVD
jgi:hypothetical protein